MPKAVSHEEPSPAGRRRSTRSQKTRPSYRNEDVLGGIQQNPGEDKNSKMPVGWDPSDDSEDEYKPELKPKVADLKLSTHDESPKPKKPRTTPVPVKPVGGSEKLSINPMFMKPDPDQANEPCVLCSFKIKVEAGNADGSNTKLRPELVSFLIGVEDECAKVLLMMEVMVYVVWVQMGTGYPACCCIITMRVPDCTN